MNWHDLFQGMALFFVVKVQIKLLIPITIRTFSLLNMLF